MLCWHATILKLVQSYNNYWAVLGFISCIAIYCVVLFWKYVYCSVVVQILIYILSSESQSHVKGWNPPAKEASSKWVFFFLLMKVRRESHLSFCDNLSLSPVISFAPLILIVLYNCVMWTSWSLKYCPYPFIITWCLEPLLYSFSCSALHCCTIKARTA